MPLATASVILQDYSLEIGLLPLVTSGAATGTSNRVISTVTLTTSSAANVGGTSVSYSAVTLPGGVTSFTIREGSGLSFIPASGARARRHCIVSADKTVTTATGSIEIQGLDKDIPAGSTLVYPIIGESVNDGITTTGLYPLAGITQIDLANQETQVDTTNFQSGSGTEMALIRVARSYTISGIALAGDEVLENIIKPVAGFKGFMFNREIYAVAMFPDGERLRGVAKITAFNMPANQNEVKKYSFNLTFQGRAFAWDAPYVFA